MDRPFFELLQLEFLTRIPDFWNHKKESHWHHLDARSASQAKKNITKVMKLSLPVSDFRWGDVDWYSLLRLCFDRILFNHHFSP